MSNLNVENILEYAKRNISINKPLTKALEDYAIKNNVSFSKVYKLLKNSNDDEVKATYNELLKESNRLLNLRSYKDVVLLEDTEFIKQEVKHDKNKKELNIKLKVINILINDIPVVISKDYVSISKELKNLSDEDVKTYMEILNKIQEIKKTYF